MDELDSNSQLVYNGLEFHWLQIVNYQGAPYLRIDGILFDVYGYQKFRRDKDHPFNRLELIPNGGHVAVIVGAWFEDVEVNQQGGAALGVTNTAISEIDSGPMAVVGNPTLLVPANANRVRGVTVQNIGGNAIVVGRSGAVRADLTAGGLILAPGAAVNDGNGDTVDFDGWLGPVYAANVAPAAGPGSVLVSAF